MTPAPLPTAAGRFRVLRSLDSSLDRSSALAEDVSLGRRVVIKMIPSAREGTALRVRLLRDADCLSKTRHEGLVPFEIFLDEDNALILARPYVEGITLAERLAQGRLSERSALSAVCGVVERLRECHAHGVLHSNLRPSNIILDPSSVEHRVTLVDIGLSREPTQAGSPAEVLPVDVARYMAPEQAGLLDHGVGEWSDLYSAGLLLFECLTGRRPVEGERFGEVLKRHLSNRLPRLSSLGVNAPSVLDQILDRMTRKDPQERYQSAEGTLADVEAVRLALDQGGEQCRLVVGLHDHRHSFAEPSFVGREKELSALHDALGLVARGSGRLVLVESESGGGKTRLLDELAQQASAAGACVARGQGVDQAALRPFQIMSGLARAVAALASEDPTRWERIREGVGDHPHALAAAFPDLAPLLGLEPVVPAGQADFGEGRILDALSSLLGLLGTPASPAVFLLDDVQWADESTLKLLRHLTRAGHEIDGSFPSHLLIIAAFRSEEVPGDHVLRGLPQAIRVELPPFDNEDVRQLLASMAGAIPSEAEDLVVRLAEGNPFMASAILRGLCETGALVPDAEGWRVEADALIAVRSSQNAVAFLERRLQLLPDSVQSLLAAGAVLGKEFELDLLAALADCSPAEAHRTLSEARKRRIVWTVGDASRYSFAHDKLREALLDQLSESERRRLHLAAAQRVESRHPERIFEIAYHFDAAGEPRCALAYALAAADEARARFALGIAEQYYRIAARGASGDRDASLRAERGLGVVLMLRGFYVEAEATLRGALAFADGDTARAEIEGHLGENAQKRGDVLVAMSHLEKGLELLGKPVPRTSLGLALRLLVEIFTQVLHSLAPRWFIGRRDPAQEPREILAIHLQNRLPYVYWFARGLLPTMWAHLKAMNDAERFAPTPELAQAYSEHAPAMTMVPLFRRGLAYARRSAALRRASGDVWGQGQSLHFTGLVLLAAAHYEEGLEACRAAVRILDRTGDQWESNTARWHVAFILYRMGRLAEAVREARIAHERATVIGDRQSGGISLGAWSKASEGLVPAALVHAELEQPSEDAHTRAELLMAEGVRLLRAAKPLQAVEALEEARSVTRAKRLRMPYVQPVWPWLATALREAAQSLPPYDPQRRSLLRRAARVANTAVRRARLYPTELPHALREKGLLLAIAARDHSARRHLDRSIRIAESQGAWYECALSLLARGRVAAARGWRGHGADVELAERRLESLRHGLDEAAGVGGAGQPSLSLLDRFSTVLEAGRRIGSALTREEVYQAVRQAALDLLRAEACAVLEVEGSVKEPRFRSVSGDGPAAAIPSLALRALAVGAPVNFRRDVPGDIDGASVPAEVRAALAAPILVRGRMAACLCVTHSQVAGLFGEEEGRLAAFILSIAGTALENAEGVQQLHDLNLKLQSLNATLEERVVERTAVIQERERQLSEAQAVAHIGSWRWDIHSDLVSWSDELHRMHGLDPETLPFDFQTFLAMNVPADRAMIEEVVRRSLRTGETFAFDHRVVRPDGTVRVFHERGQVVMGESGPLRMFGTSQDVTERRRAEALIGVLRSTAIAANEAATIDDALRITLDEICRHLGWPLGRAYVVGGDGLQVVPTPLWHADDPAHFESFRRAAMETAFARGVGLAGRVLETGRPAWIADVTREEDFELRGLATEVGIRGAFALPILAGAEVAAVLEFYLQTVAEDDDALMEVMLQAGTQLGRVFERAWAERRLRMYASRLEDSNKELEHFAYVASHDLQEPLRLVASYTQLLAKRYKGKLDPDADEFIAFAVDGASRMQRLIGDLLAYSRLSSQSDARESVACEPALQEALENLRLAIEESEAVITKDPLPTVVANPSQIVQLFQNLIGNAIKFRKEESPRVHVSAREEGGQWVFSVQDNGIGIAPQYAERIFVIFQRLHRIGEYPGTGIGLALCKKIVERHGGRIWVTSDPAKGATFHFTLPAEPAP